MREVTPETESRLKQMLAEIRAGHQPTLPPLSRVICLPKEESFWTRVVPEGIRVELTTLVAEQFAYVADDQHILGWVKLGTGEMFLMDLEQRKGLRHDPMKLKPRVSAP